MSKSLRADVEKAVADSRRLDEDYFMQQCRGLTSPEILNFYRNYYYQEPSCTEHGLVAVALNEILPNYTRYVQAHQLALEGRFDEAIKRILK